MPIAFKCTCGKIFKVGDEHAGKKTTCPTCGAKLKVPAPQKAAPAAAADGPPDLAALDAGLDPLGPLNLGPDLSGLEGAGLAPTAAGVGAELCPNCRAPLSPFAVVCTQCGHDKRSPARPAKKKSAGLPMPVLLSAIGGGVVCLGLAIWGINSLFSKRQAPPDGPVAKAAGDSTAPAAAGEGSATAVVPSHADQKGAWSTLKAHREPIEHLAISPDGRTLVSADRTEVKLWDIAKKQERLLTQGYARHLSLSPDGRWLAISMAGYQGTIAVGLWDVATGKEVLSLVSGWVANRLAFSADGRTLAACGSVVRLWDLTTGLELAVPLEPPDEQRVVTLFTPPPALSYVLLTGDVGGRLAFSPDGKQLATLVTQVESRTAEASLWDVGTGKKTWSLPPLPTSRALYPPCRFTSDGKHIVIASMDDNSVRIHDAATGQERSRLKSTAGSALIDLVWFGKTLAATGVTQGTIKLWDVSADREIGSFATPTGQVALAEAMAFSHDGKIVAMANPADGSTSLLLGAIEVTVADSGLPAEAPTSDPNQPSPRAIPMPAATFAAHGGPINNLAFTPDGTGLLTSGARVPNGPPGEGDIKLWDFATQKELDSYDFKAGVSFIEDGLLCTIQPGKPVELTDPVNKNVVATLPEIGLLSPDRKALALWTNEGRKLEVKDLASNKRLWVLETPFIDTIGAHRFSPDGKLFLNMLRESKDRVVKYPNSVSGQLEDGYTRAGEIYPTLFDAKSGQERSVLFSRTVGAVTRDSRFVFSHDGKHLAISAGRDGILLYDVASGRLKSSSTDGALMYDGSSTQYYDLAFSPDDTVLAVLWNARHPQMRIGPLVFFDVASGKALAAPEVFQNPNLTDSPGRLAWSPDGKFLVTGNRDGSVTLWGPRLPQVKL